MFPAPTRLTGAGTDKPLVIAQARVAASSTSSQLATPIPQENDPHFDNFLRELAGLSSSLPDCTNDTAIDGLANYRTFTGILEKFKPFTRRKGGYLIPHGECFSVKIRSQADHAPQSDWAPLGDQTLTTDNWEMY